MPMPKANGPGRREGTYSQATRVLRLADHLRRHVGLTFGELAERFEVTERQIERDLTALEDAGYALDYVTGDDRRMRVRLAAVRPGTIHLGVRERYTLLAVRRVFDVLRDTAFFEDVESIYEKLAAALPDDGRKHLATLGGRFVYVPDGGTKAYRGKEDVLDALLTGVIRRLRVRYRYRNATGAIKSGLMDPHAMVLYRLGLYVIAQTTDDEAAAPPPADGKKAARRGRRSPHVYAAERFLDAAFVAGQAFEVPADFKVDDYFQGAFGIFRAGDGAERQRVIVDVTKEARPYVEARVWHKSQRLFALPGGGVRLAFDIENLAEVRPWIRSWGELARVREPRDLNQ